MDTLGNGRAGETDITNLDTNREYSVCIRHALKKYGSNQVLNNLNMTVNKGTIYGLLGASGCGKTTLLSCIIGRRKFDHGDIWVLGGKPGSKESGIPGKRVGYMPQEIALYEEFTIKETMFYFGWIFGMATKEINSRLLFLLNLLDLPNQSRMIKNLSCGQQRRVSFAVALMHDPELLILDEPTVGVDPLLRRSIWNHLVEITRNGQKTVIITTHYIEEARQAHSIGLMRNGKLLAEESPQVLLSIYGCTSLEDVFLKLSMKQAEEVSEPPEPNLNKQISTSLNWNGKDMPKENGRFNTIEISSPKSILDYRNKSTSLSVGKMRALIQKNFLRTCRNIGMMLFMFAMPVFQIILFCLAIGGDPQDLKLGIVNFEQSFADLKHQECPYDPGCSIANFSCRYLDILDTSTIVKRFYPDVETAKAAVKKGEAWGTIHVSENFSVALVNRILYQKTDQWTLDQSEIKVWLDMSNQQIAVILEKEIQFSYQKFLEGLLKTCNQDEHLAESAVSFKQPIYGSEQPSFKDFMAPGVILSIPFFLALALTATSLIAERVDGLLDRSWVAGVTPSEILSAHVFIQFIIMCGQAALVLIIVILVFKIECQGSIFLVSLIAILQGFCGMSYGFIISALCDTERNATQVSLGSYYPALLLSGLFWPLEGMPTILRHISTYLPLTLANSSLRAMMTRGWGITEPEVYYGFIASCAWIAIFLIISLVAIKLRKG